jgi:HD-like signal output (HDOD) protein
LGTDHAEVGGALLQAWHLPEEISEAVANHHRPVLAPKPKLSAVAHLANCIAYRVNAAPGVESAEGRVEERVMEAFGLSDERLENIVTGVRESCEHVDQLMSLA